MSFATSPEAYYQSLLPVYQTNTNGNGRADVMRMAQVVAACVPNAIAVPINGARKRTFKLELIAEANGIRLDNAHEALADARESDSPRAAIYRTINDQLTLTD